MDGIENLWAKLQLLEMEEEPMEIIEEDVGEVRQKGEFCLIGKI